MCIRDRTGGPPGRGRKPADILLQPLIFLHLKLILTVLVLLPAGKIPPLHLNVAAVNREDVIDTAVEEGTVMGNQDKAPLAFEILRNHLPGMLIQMVGGLIDEEKVVLSQEKGCQQDFGPFPLAQGGKRAVEDLAVHLQQGKLPE